MEREDMSTFTTPVVHTNAEGGWGPDASALPEQFLDVPYAPFGKSDRIGRAADFTAPVYFQNRSFRNRRGEDNAVNAEFQYKYDNEEDEAFRLVDTTKSKQNRFGPRNRWNNNRGRGRGRGGRFGGRFGETTRGQPAASQGGQAGKDRTGGRFIGVPKNKWERQRLARGRGPYRRDRQRTDRQASVQVLPDWQVVEEFELPQLTKLQTNIPKAEDIQWCGFLEQYDDQYDRITSRTERRLQRCEKKEFYYVTTTDDPVMEKLAVEGKGNVFATDAILAHLMASPRTIYPWDIVVQKVNGTLFLDKREASQLDYLTVNETAVDPPTPGDDPTNNINAPDRLSLEATMINQNFSQQILKPGNRKNLEMPNPFFDKDEAAPGMTPAAIGYRYRKFQLGANYTVVARCEVHGTAVKPGMKAGEKQYMSAFALNEWDSKLAGGVEWRQKIDTQRGAILATELKNNSAKLAKWTAQSILSGADQMKIGLVSRVTKANAYEHVVLGTQSYKPREFATQITLSANNMWGIIHMIVELLMKHEDGKYVVMKDPNKQVVRVYSVPANTFESDDEDETDDDDDVNDQGQN
ncbi:unnamed protein product [Ectocarpus sp. 6 AP-2014]